MTEGLNQELTKLLANGFPLAAGLYLVSLRSRCNTEKRSGESWKD